MRFGSVCSGIEAASVAWHPLGWRAAWFAEIEAFPSAVLAHHYQGVPNLGDMTALPELIRSGAAEAPDLLCGGTPCQAFSVAGLRRSLDDARGNLTLTFCEIADAIDAARHVRGEPAAVVFWENVPGVLSTRDNAFGCFLAQLVGGTEPLYAADGWTDAGVVSGPRRTAAWRVLDAQYFSLAQRRRRVFVVASARDGFDPAAVLLEWEGMRRDTPPSREARKVAPTIPLRSTAGGGLGTDFDCDGGLVRVSKARLRCGCGYEFDDRLGEYGCPNCEGDDGPAQPISDVVVMAHGQGGAEVRDDGGAPCLTCNHEAPIAAIPATAHTLRGEGFDASEDGTGRSTPLVPVHCRDVAQTITSNYGKQVDNSDTGLGPNVIAFDTTQITSKANYSNPKAGDPCHPLAAGAHAPAIAFHGSQDPDVSGDVTHPVGRNQGQETCVAYTTKLHNTGSNNAGKLFGERATCLDANSPPPAVFTFGGNADADAAKARSIEALRTLRDAVGEEAFTVWSLGVLAALQPSKVLQQHLHESGFRPAAFSRSWVVHCALSRAENGSGWLLQSLRETRCEGCPPQGWEPPEQLAGELRAYLSELSQPGAQAARLMRDLWSASEGAGLLRQALSAVQEMGRPAHGQSQSTHGAMQVRRLTVEECEFLQGFPRGYTAIPWRGKPASECPDGPRYKALGNSWAVPVVRWIGRRIAEALA